jgi:hypothetical protein
VVVRGIEKKRIKGFLWRRQVVKWGFHLCRFPDDPTDKELFNIVNYVILIGLPTLTIHERRSMIFV